MTDELRDKRTKPVFMHSAIDDMTELSPNDFRVYMHLARRSNSDTGYAWPSYQSIGDHCFSCISSNAATRKSFARKSVANLIDAGLVEKHSRHAEDGGQQTNAYVLVDPPCLLSTPRVYLAPPVPNKHQRYSIEGTQVEEKDNDDKATGVVFATLQDNGIFVGPGLADMYGDLIDEVGADNVLRGIQIAIANGALRKFNYVAKCARDQKYDTGTGEYHASRKQAPKAANANANKIKELGL